MYVRFDQLLSKVLLVFVILTVQLEVSLSSPFFQEIRSYGYKPVTTGTVCSPLLEQELNFFFTFPPPSSDHHRNQFSNTQV